MIEIKVSNLDSMPPATIRKIAGLFEVIADYAATGVPAPQPEYRDRQDLAESFQAAASEGTVPTPPAAQDAFGKLDIPAILKLTPTEEPPLPPVHENPNLNAPAVDAAGLPWDGRIHASSKAIIADGTWRKKRGVEDDLVAKVEAELKQAMSAPAIPEPPAVAVPVPPPTVASAEPSTPETATGPIDLASAGVAPTASPSEPTEIPADFPTFMRAVTAKFAAKELTQPQIQQAVAKVGLPSLPMLATRPDLIRAVAAELGVMV